ncbi:MAG: cation:proton antiporter [Chloroflexi bacterium]|nr:cation:proton antiporter [Chloroflexota bacterium]
MPEQLGLFLDLAVAFTTALLGGLLAQRLRLSPLVGYLLAGLAIGPHTSMAVSEVGRVRLLAEMGVVFLMFGLGVQFSMGHLRRTQAATLLGGVGQVLGTVGLGALVGLGLGWPLAVGVFFGSLLALSSTMVVLRVLMDRAEVDTAYGRILVAMLIVQDLSVVPMVVVLPALGSASPTLAQDVVLALLKATAIVGAVVYLGSHLIPALLFRVALTRSRELFLLAVVALALGTAAAAALLGLSLAFGAFIAGLVVSESAFTHQILADILPLRDIFSILFFVSLGMLLDPAFLLREPGLVALALAVIVPGKLALTALPIVALGMPIGVALRAGLGMVQVGEFSFVLAESGVQSGLIPPDLYSLTLVAALITIPLTPFALRLGPRAAHWAETLPLAGPLRREHDQPHEVAPLALEGWHAVIAGFGELGRSLAHALEQRGFRYLVIDHDPSVIEDLHRRHVPHIFGDASNERVLERARLERARVLAITIPDSLATEAVVRIARRLYPRVDIIARAGHHEALELLRQSGATEVVHPPFEAGLEMIRHSLHRFGVSSTETLAIVNRLREEHYQRASSPLEL